MVELKVVVAVEGRGGLSKMAGRQYLARVAQITARGNFAIGNLAKKWREQVPGKH
jgi:hypothetical protein